MKKGWMYFFLFVLIFLLNTVEAKASSNSRNIPIAVNDGLISFPDALPFVRESTTYVPVRFFSESIGAKLTVEKSGIISITLKEKSVTVYMNRNEIQFSNGRIVKLSIFNKDGRIYAPLRSLGEYFGYEVHYIGEGPIVRIINSKYILERQQFLKINQTVMKEFFRKEIEDNQPKVYLTFDDGPNNSMKVILDILKKKEIKASFFMIETQMKAYANELKRLVKEGHYPALHSVSHNKHSLYNGKPSAVTNEMLKTQKTLYEITGIQSKLTRAPYGSTPYMIKSFRDELVRHDFKMWDWNIDSEDWKYFRTNPRQIVTNVKEGFKKLKYQKDPIVILFHVNSGTASVLSELIDYIYSQGYQFAVYTPEKHFVVNFWNDKRL